MKSRLIYIDLFRVYLCVAILLYHIGILKGGYLAVCSFFVLSGYLSAQMLKKEDFSLLAYYKSRFIRVYLPMLLVVFASLALCMTFMSDTLWVSMKQEITSIVFCKNNFWQLSANMDYFARHVDSPYMHLWYVSILLQLEFVFPLIYFVLRFLKDKMGLLFSVLLCVTAGIFSMLWFVFVHMSDGLMEAYYDTFTRCFAWFVGIAVGICHVGDDSDVSKKIEDKSLLKYFLFLLVIIQTALFIIASAESKLYLGAMLATTGIMCILLYHAKFMNNSMSDAPKKIIGYFSNISYEIFLVQYPVIYMLQDVGFSSGVRYILIAVITVVIAVLLNFALHPVKRPLFVKIVTVALLLSIVAGAGYGGYRYIEAPDLQAELERLEEEMALMAQEQERKQQEYEKQLREEEAKKKLEEEELLEDIEETNADIDEKISSLERKIDNIETTVYKQSITFVGDSVLLGASDVLYEYFSKCYVDAEIGRTAYVIEPILVSLRDRGILGEVVVINCGSNGDCPDEYKDIIMEALTDRQVFWVTATNNDGANETIFDYAEGYENLHVIDWATISEGHEEYFAGDGLHLEQEGKYAYAQAIMDSICSYYVEELEAEILELEKQRIEE